MTKWRDTGAYRKRRGLGKDRRRRRSLRYLLNEDETPSKKGSDTPVDAEQDEALAMMLPKEAEPQTKRGFFSRLFSRSDDKERPTPKPVGQSQHDFVREILSVPRGISRLDAFERILKDDTLDVNAQSPVALAYHRELTSLAKNANLDLSLLSSRAQVCADALLRTGEVEKAGEILARIGDQRKASELFVQAGAVEKLERLHRETDLKRGTRLSGRMAYDRFEGLFALGLRRQALAALEQAAKLWPENGIYSEIAVGFRERALEGNVTLKVGQRVYELSAALPVVIGRGEEATLRLNSPLVSRAHVEIRNANLSGEPEVVVHDLQGRGDVLVGEFPVKREAPLAQNSHLSVAGVRLEVTHDSTALWLKSPDHARTLLVPLQGDGVSLLDGTLRITFENERVFAVPAEGLKHEGRGLKHPLMLMRGDILHCGESTVTIL